MADISKIKLPNGTTYSLKDASSVKGIKLDGTTYSPVSGIVDLGSSSGAFGGVEMHGVDLAANAWSNKTQTVTIPTYAIATSDFLSVPQIETSSEYSASGVVLSSATVNVSAHTASLVFSCTTVPTATVSTTVLVSTSAMETEIALADAIANYPKIQNGKWYVWNVSTKQWVNTGVKAGITSIVQTTTSTADGGTNVVTATLSDGTKTTFNIKNGQKGSTGPKGDTGDSGNFYFSNKAVAASAWVADTTYKDYPVKATVTCTGVTANDGVDLVYGMADATSGNFAPIANTVSNGVEIWAKEAAAITIPTIIIHPPANGSIATPTATWLDQVYPVGSIYMSVNSSSPANLFGGSWTQLKDRFLLGAGSSYSAGATGGEATHTLTINEMPSHQHDHEGQTFLWGGGVSNAVYCAINAVAGTTSNNYIYTMQNIDGWADSYNTGGGAAHNNMPPYLVVYMWVRTS